MEQTKLIKQINDLARLQKIRSLTDEELQLQKQLRQIYLENFRSGFKSQLASIKVVDIEGNDVTPSKLTDLKKELNEKKTN